MGTRNFCVCSAVTIYRMANRSGAKIRRKWERKWKMAPGLKWPKNGHRNRKMAPKMGFGPFFSSFSISAAISGRGPFSIFFPIFPGFLRRTGLPFCRWSPQTQRNLPWGAHLVGWPPEAGNELRGAQEAERNETTHRPRSQPESCTCSDRERKMRTNFFFAQTFSTP